MVPLRFVTAASLFDGHDVSINIMRRLLQSKGVEVIHLGHNRSAQEVVTAAICEDVQAVALSSYQGGHNEYFRYIRQLLDESGASHIKIFGGGGGVITQEEIDALHRDGVTRIYSPADGAALGLEGIIDDMIRRARDQVAVEDLDNLKDKILSDFEMGRVLSFIENKGLFPFPFKEGKVPVLGVTGTGGAGKSSLIDEILLRFHMFFPEKRIGLITIDPTRKRSKGALLGDRIRLGSAVYENIFIRSMATRDSQNELNPSIGNIISFLRSRPFDLIMVETSGIGQSSDLITAVSDFCLYVMTPEYGAQTQLEKIEMLEAADFIVINKFERSRAEDALRDVRKQYRRNRKLFNFMEEGFADDDLPVYGTMASQFNDEGVNCLFFDISKKLGYEQRKIERLKKSKISVSKFNIIPPSRKQYLREISDVCRKYNKNIEEKSRLLKEFEACEVVLKSFDNNDLFLKSQEIKNLIGEDIFKELEEFDKNITEYQQGEYHYQVRDKIHSVKTKFQSLAGLLISKVGIPHFSSSDQKFIFIRKQNLPGFFPFAAGIFPFKRSDEEPKRMFAGEGGPTRTNSRFHYLSKNDPAKRLSTAFDSVTLYGEDPALRPDIFGKVGESGVSICTLTDMEELFKGFRLVDKNTSVSMTINGPAPILLAMFMNTAIKQELSNEERFDLEKRIEVMRQVRGTVQADILKEDQAQNTCIFSLEFSLKLMGDVQEYFCKNKIFNYYTVSISGYHIAEAGANPITQLAFTLANGFTFVEYYLNRGLLIDEFAPNLSFFFSIGLDPEYSVMGRVARKIWAVAMKEKYGAGEKSQKLKYHIQTSGRSLHAQEMNFNDIRTTLQAFLALSDNCNSLHTNAYDEAVTTPTEESVRRAMAIQLIINREFGPNKTDNPMQGAFIYDELTDLVEEAVLVEFERIAEKGGVLEAMESMYQRSKIQDESLYYETLKDSGAIPIIGVNTYLSKSEDSDSFNPKIIPLSRSSQDEKNNQIERLSQFKNIHSDNSQKSLDKLKEVALRGGNIFEELLETVNFCSLGQITELLYEVGGKYRRNM